MLIQGLLNLLESVSQLVTDHDNLIEILQRMELVAPELSFIGSSFFFVVQI